MLLGMAVRAITHFAAPAKEPSDSGSCSHRSDLKLWPQRNATCPTATVTQSSAPASMESVGFVWVARSKLLFALREEKLVSRVPVVSVTAFFLLSKRLLVLRRSSLTVHPRTPRVNPREFQFHHPSNHLDYLLNTLEEQTGSNRVALLTNNCTGSVEHSIENAEMGRGAANQQSLTYWECWNGKERGQLAKPVLRGGEWPISNTWLMGRGVANQ